jgi:endogenous inhibitor of DNA gyrase (YacG/DUF329 family)
VETFDPHEDGAQEAKQCPSCQKRKPFSEFNRDRTRKTGLQVYCRPCQRAAVRLAAKRHRPAKAARQRGWAKEHRVITYAHTLVHRAVLSGKLVKPAACEDCGQSATGRALHGHHEDYSKPLSVKWLCPSCHRIRHDRERAVNV